MAGKKKFATRGKPLKFKSVKLLQDAIDAYFSSCWAKKLDMFGNPVKDKETGEQILKQFKPYTITGLAVALDTTRETLLDYEAKEDYSDTIKKAKEKCKEYAENHLFATTQAAGAIFNLKNNYGWKDKTETDITSGGKPFDGVERVIIK